MLLRWLGKITGELITVFIKVENFVFSIKRQQCTIPHAVIWNQSQCLNGSITWCVFMHSEKCGCFVLILNVVAVKPHDTIVAHTVRNISDSLYICFSIRLLLMCIQNLLLLIILSWPTGSVPLPADLTRELEDMHLWKKWKICQCWASVLEWLEWGRHVFSLSPTFFYFL